jgi:hypothetical protein
MVVDPEEARGHLGGHAMCAQQVACPHAAGERIRRVVRSDGDTGF